MEKGKMSSVIIHIGGKFKVYIAGELIGAYWFKETAEALLRYELERRSL